MQTAVRARPGPDGRGSRTEMANVTLRQTSSKIYPGGVEAIKGISTLNVGDGQFCVLVGPSGCGKSTLLRMIAGLEHHHVRARSTSADRVVNEIEPADRDIAMVFQNYALYPHMTVYNNMAYGLRNREAWRRREIKTACRPKPHASWRTRARCCDRKPRAIVRRPAPARGDGPRDRARTGGLPVRRAAVQPRREAPRADAGSSSDQAAHDRVQDDHRSTSRTTRSRR